MNKPIQVKLGEQTFTFRPLSAIAIWKRVGFPINENGETSMQDMSKLAPSIMEATCTEPSKLEALSFTELAQLMAEPEFMDYFQSLMQKPAKN